MEPCSRGWDGPFSYAQGNGVHQELHTWDKEVLKGPRKCIHALEKELTEVRRGPLTANSVSMEKELLLKIELLLKQEEIQWIQRGRANWLCHGDRNTKKSIIFPQHEGRRIL